MNILFCNEGFIIDGVASYNLYLSASLQKAGNNVAIIGRWAGIKGFQKRHRNFGVKVIQCPSFTVHNCWLIRQAIKFRPDIIITDARRSFPFAQRIRKKTGAKVVTVFHDPDTNSKKHGRSTQALVKGSDVWVTPERPIYEALKKDSAILPTYCISRPITGMIHPTPLPPLEPFRILCLGRLSRWKSPGFRVLVDKAVELRAAIPSLEIVFVGGGGHFLHFWKAAKKANNRAGENFVRVVGTQTDPQPWIRQATVVCAGATSAIETILCNRPVLAFSGFWIGFITEQNLTYGVSSHFGERYGDFYVKDNPDVVYESLIDLYKQWKRDRIIATLNKLRQRLAPDFDSATVANEFRSLFEKI